ncbi:hypothetical protein [Paenibacillus sp. Y412MC10]|uniref:hypothetical protein n=1 Tax=Geobacillus sp. (strain Y412MC10) TaxID=481743 RepID=UPI0011AB70B5|nr:hypothetical protein [Paenibacillus sp. Y412MC10]
MAKFKMARSYERGTVLDTKDLLTAVKTICNYEGDLYSGGTLIMSCLGLSRNENTRRLLEYGITSFVNQRSKCWNYRYTDPEKNVPTYFVNSYHYNWEGTPKIEFTIKEYREYPTEVMFDSLASVMAFVRETVAASPDQITNLDEDIHVRLFGEDGLIYFAPGDWQAEGEPEMYVLRRKGGQPEYGAKHYLEKRYNQLQPKLGDYLIAPANNHPRDPFSAGEVVMLETAVEGLDPDRLYLICGVKTIDGEPYFTIRDLDEYEVTAKVRKSQISSPKVAVRQ